MNTAINRENVQKILDRNSAEAKRKEAALEDQARKLRLIINANHTAKLAEQFPPEQPERPQEEPKEAKEALARRQEKRAERAMEAAECHAWYRFMFGAFSPILIAAPVIALAGGSPVTILASFLLAAYTFLIATLIIKAFSPISRLTAYFSRLLAEARTEIQEIIHEFIDIIKRKEVHA